MSLQDYKILLFYKYTPFENPEKIRKLLYGWCYELNLKGRLIVAQEGLNITVEGLPENTSEFQKRIATLPGCEDIHWKISDGDGTAFPKLSVKVRPEIVSAHLGEMDLNPNQITGKYIYAEELHDLIHSDKEFYIIDMRNDYEHAVGHFAGSILPELSNFRDLPKILPSIEHLKDKLIVTVCTGGVRCEKASGFLVQNGFKNVYQLFGGIVTYMEKYPNQDFLGSLYVFDNRIVMAFHSEEHEHIVVGRCAKCGIASERYVNCAWDECHKHFICCANCSEKNGKTYCDSDCIANEKANVKLGKQKVQV